MTKNQWNNLLGLVGVAAIVLSIAWLLVFACLVVVMGVDGAVAWMIDLFDGGY